MLIFKQKKTAGEIPAASLSYIDGCVVISSSSDEQHTTTNYLMLSIS